MRASSVVALLVAIVLSLHGCANPARPIAAPAASTTAVVDTRGANVYVIDRENSTVSILVYRAGTLARFGHNHVMTANQLAGQVWVNPEFEKSGFDISFQVADLIVDDADARRAAGSDFPPEIAQADKDATRSNMLKAEVLDAERFPEIRVQATSVRGTLAAPKVVVGISIKGDRREIEIPISLSVESSRLSAHGEFDILQSEFGIKPFSVGLGTLQVQDRLHIRFAIVADHKR
jgi:polyisoprenoid-binding protein YceI